jgi:hypothetical protein
MPLDNMFPVKTTTLPLKVRNQLPRDVKSYPTITDTLST